MIARDLLRHKGLLGEYSSQCVGWFAILSLLNTVTHVFLTVLVFRSTDKTDESAVILNGWQMTKKTAELARGSITSRCSELRVRLCLRLRLRSRIRLPLRARFRLRSRLRLHLRFRVCV